MRPRGVGEGVAIVDIPRHVPVFDDEAKAEQLAGLTVDTRTCAQKHDALLAWLVQRVDALEMEVRRLRATTEMWDGD